MKIAFIGTPYFAATFLQKLSSSASEIGLEIAVVLTQPDQPQGRKKVLTPSLVKVMAQSLDIPVITRLSDLTNYPVDLALLFAYGELIPQRILDFPQYGFWNIHPSLLPAYRGASPITYPVLLGDTITGVTLMQMDADLDHGPILAQEPSPINNSVTRKELESTLTELAFAMFKTTFSSFQALKNVPCQPQIHAHATFTRLLTKDDGYIPYLTLNKALNGEIITENDLPEIVRGFYEKNSDVIDMPTQFQAASVVYNAYRALIEWPGLWTLVTIHDQPKRLKLLSLHQTDTTIVIDQVQLEGKNPVTFAEFNRAYQCF